MLALRDLALTYPHGAAALAGVTLDVPAGIFGLLGPNGAGKSTLLRILATLQRPDRGTVTFDGRDILAEPAWLRAQLGYLPQDFGLYPGLTVDELLGHFCTLKGAVDRAERDAWVTTLLERTNLASRRRTVAGALSGGMRQRLGLAIALAGAPRLLLLDEPTAGLDPGERHRIYDLLAGIGDEVVVVLSTHLTDDVPAICRRFAILHRGRITAAGDPAAALADLRAARRDPALAFEALYFAHVADDDAP